MPEDAAAEIVRVLDGVLSSIKGVVGDGAAQALLRYGAFEEGRRIAREGHFDGVEDAVAHVGALLVAEVVCETPDDAVRLRFASCPALEPQSLVLDTLVLGLFDGLLLGVLSRRFRGVLSDRGADGQAVARFAPSGD